MVLGFLVSVPGCFHDALTDLAQAHGYATHEFEVTPERLACYLPACVFASNHGLDP